MLIGINDINVKCQGHPFARCFVQFRNGLTPERGEVKLSELSGPTYKITKKGKIFCFCNGFKNEKRRIKFFKHLEEIALKNMYKDMTPAQEDEERNYANDLYETVKKNWASSNLESTNEAKRNVALALHKGYASSIEFAEQCLAEDFPGFTLIDHEHEYYQLSCPSLVGLRAEGYVENYIKRLRYADKFKTYTQLALLHKVRGEIVNSEILVIFNYLNNFDACHEVETINMSNFLKDETCQTPLDNAGTQLSTG